MYNSAPSISIKPVYSCNGTRNVDVYEEPPLYPNGAKGETSLHIYLNQSRILFVQLMMRNQFIFTDILSYSIYKHPDSLRTQIFNGKRTLGRFGELPFFNLLHGSLTKTFSYFRENSKTKLFEEYISHLLTVLVP